VGIEDAGVDGLDIVKGVDGRDEETKIFSTHIGFDV
jgi:hypothetical protein